MVAVDLCAACPNLSRRPDEPYWFALQHFNLFVAAGTIELVFQRQQHAIQSLNQCKHWHCFGSSLITDVADADIKVTHLESLIQQGFLICTWRMNALGDTALIRIYLVPSSLNEVHRKLYLRTQKEQNETFTWFRDLLPAISKNQASWRGDYNQRFGPALINHQPASASLNLGACFHNVRNSG